MESVMELSAEIRRLLEEMRDIQREHLAEYPRAGGSIPSLATRF
jgi:hypothetical protein